MDERREVFAARAVHMRQEIESIFADTEYWNRLHPDEAPIDPDPFGELAAWRAWLDAMFPAQERTDG